MSTISPSPAAEQWKLPPVILHPFAGDQGAERILEGTRAQLSLQGVTPSNSDRESLTRLMLLGRYYEMRMLFYIGKDLQRWTSQCCDFASRHPQLRATEYREQCFATLLVEYPPAGVGEKLAVWGISEPRAIFMRAIGLNTLFDEPPDLNCLSPFFVQNYHRVADYLFICYKSNGVYPEIDPSQFRFDIYASEEYARILAQEWK